MRSVLAASVLVVLVAVGSTWAGVGHAVAVPPSPAAGATSHLLPASTPPRSLGSAHPVEPMFHPLGGGQGRLLVNSTDPLTTPNTGIETNITVYAATNLLPDSSFQVAAEEVIGGYDAVFGLFQNSVTYPVAFFGVFSNSTDATVHLAYWANLTLSVGQTYGFALTLTNGTTWTLTVNGLLFGASESAASFDFGVTEATWAGGTTFSEVALYSYDLSTPSLVDVPLAFATRTATGWHLPANGQAYLVTGEERWGAAGRAQNGLLAPGAIESGVSVANFTDGVSLWNGGPVPVTVAESLSATEAPGMYPVEVFLSVTLPGGPPLPNVPLALTDTAGGMFMPPTLVTNLNGGASAVLATPNVTAPTVDTIRASVTLLGFIGGSTVYLSLVPATEVLLEVAPSPSVVTEGTPIGLVVRATDASGAPVEGVLLLLGVRGGTATYEPWITTDTRGEAHVTLVPYVGTSSLTLVARVAAPGFWGQAAFPVTVVHAPQTLWSVLQPYVAGAILGALAVLLVLFVRRERRRRRPIPTLGTVLEPPPVNRTRP